MKTRFRTSLGLLSIAAAMALSSAFVVSFGVSRLSMRAVLERYPLWPYFALIVGCAGVLLILAKGKALPSFLNAKVVGYLALAPLVVLVTAAAFYRVGPALAFFLTALPGAYLAIRLDEPPAGDKEERALIDFIGAALLLLFGIFGFLLPPPTPFVAPAPALVVALVVAPAAAFFCWREPNGIRARLARVALGVALGAVGALAVIRGQPAFGVLYLPTAILLLLHPFLDRVRIGAPRKPGPTDEHEIVASFEKMAELTAWSVFLFALVHVHFNPPGMAIVLFALFVAAFVVFTVEYEMLPVDKHTYEFSQKKSLANAVLLATISHLTGGILSPYVWFFVLIVVSGAFVPDPRMILRRLYVIMGYFALETAYSWAYGLLDATVIVDRLLVRVFVIGLTGIYAYRLSLRRREIDADLMAKNETLHKALEGEQAAKALAERRAIDLRVANVRREAMLASLADAVIGLDADARVESLNPSAEGLLGVSIAEAKGKHLPDFLRFGCDGEDGFRIGEYMAAASRGSAVALPENVFLERAGGVRLYLTGAAVPMLDEKRAVTGIVLTFSDVTYAREIDRMKTDFLSVAAHQLRTPLSTIRWYLELLGESDKGKLKKNQRMFVENAYQSVRKMVGLVNRLLAVTRLESGRVPFRPEPTDLKALTAEILESQRLRLQQRKLEIRTDIADLPAVPLDRTLAREAFSNLIENAIRYTPDGGRISIEARDAGDHLEWSVADNGIGIPMSQQEKIFSKFFRARNAVEHSSEGSGLGLYLAKFIVDIWGGNLTFESAEGKGSTFRVTIPKAGMKAKAGQVSLNA